jgi:hypothetical protein
MTFTKIAINSFFTKDQLIEMGPILNNIYLKEQIIMILNIRLLYKLNLTLGDENLRVQKLNDILKEICLEIGEKLYSDIKNILLNLLLIKNYTDTNVSNNIKLLVIGLEIRINPHDLNQLKKFIFFYSHTKRFLG